MYEVLMTCLAVHKRMLVMQITKGSKGSALKG